MSPRELPRVSERHLVALYELLPEALQDRALAPEYATFLARIRERIHPRGQRDVRPVRTRTGLVLDVDVGDRLGCDFYYGYFHEYADYHLFLSLVHASDVVFDVGANFGVYALGCAATAGFEGKVYAFEPNLHVFDLLLRNVAGNGLSSLIECVPVALGAHPGQGELVVAEESSFSGLHDTGRSKVLERRPVDIVTLDGVRAAHGLPGVDLLKIDVEGEEASVLKGGRQLLAESRDTVVMLEVSPKNLTEEGRGALGEELGVLFREGYRGWTLGATEETLLHLPSVERVTELRGNNVYLARAGSRREGEFLAAVRGLAPVLAARSGFLSSAAGGGS